MGGANIERYDYGSHGELESNSDGEWVRWRDVQTLLSAVDRQLARHICYTEEGSRKRFWQALGEVQA